MLLLLQWLMMLLLLRSICDKGASSLVSWCMVWWGLKQQFGAYLLLAAAVHPRHVLVSVSTTFWCLLMGWHWGTEAEQREQITILLNSDQPLQ